jgi:hypothetical protein
LKEVDGAVYECDCAMITLGAVEVSKLLSRFSNLQHVLISLIDTGANASAEEAEEGVEDGAVQVNNVVNSFRLSQTSFDKKTYLSHLKGM